MGYETYLCIRTIGGTVKQRKACQRKLVKIANLIGTEVESFEIDGNEHGVNVRAHNYGCLDRDADMLPLSQKYPELIIEVSGEGEVNDDLWIARYRNGKKEENAYNPASICKFSDILTEGETERIFVEANAEYHTALDAMRKAARRRIQALKKRITGSEEAFLSLHILNKRFNQLVVSCQESYVSNKSLIPGVVTCIHDDGETFATDLGDPTDLFQMVPSDIAEVVTCLEQFVKEIEGGVIKGRWNEEDEWYELYYADQDPDEETMA